ncbi:hypothetical protein Tco_1556528 [Tanacetum coccineum]
MVKTGLVEAIDSLVPLDEHLATFRVWGILETDIQEQDKKKAKNKQSRARNGKDKVKPKPKSVKVRKSTKSKVNQLKKIQLEGLKLPNLKLYY